MFHDLLQKLPRWKNHKPFFIFLPNFLTYLFYKLIWFWNNQTLKIFSFISLTSFLFSFISLTSFLFSYVIVPNSLSFFSPHPQPNLFIFSWFHKIQFSNLYIFATWCRRLFIFQNMNYEKLNSLVWNIKYLHATSDWKKNQFVLVFPISNSSCDSSFSSNKLICKRTFPSVSYRVPFLHF